MFLNLGHKGPLEGVASRLKVVDEGVVEVGETVTVVGDVVALGSTAGDVATSLFDLLPTTAPPTVAPTIAKNTIAPQETRTLESHPAHSLLAIAWFIL